MLGRALRAATLVVIGISAAACDEKLSDVTGPTPNLAPTFTSIQRDIFDARDSSGRRACTECHNATGSQFNGLNLVGTSAYGNLVNAPVRQKPGAIRVIPGDPENSYVIHKVEGRAGIVGQRMPIAGPFLSDGQVLVLKRWIELGAPND